MAKNNDKMMRFQAREEDFEAAYSFVEELVTRKDINSEVASEALLVFEALFQNLIDSGMDEDAILEISGKSRLGNLRIIIGHEGPMIAQPDGSEDSIEDQILRAHEDKLDFSYREGYNAISISVSRSYRRSTFACLIAMLCAIVCYIPVSMFVDAETQKAVLAEYVFPLEGLYTNAVLMIGAPLTFFSLLKNLTDTYVVTQRHSSVRRLQVKTIATSVVAVLLAIVAGFILTAPLDVMEGIDSEYGGSGIAFTFADSVSSIMPSSIFEPFETLSPIPLIIVALLVTYALCSTGKHFDTLRTAMEACYALFSRMLRVVMALLPFFCFVAFFDVLLDGGYENVPYILLLAVLIVFSLVLLFASYAIRLRVHGIKVIPFVRKLLPLLRENIKIGSVIDATPFNIRYCARTYGMDRKRLEKNMPVLAQTNLDGNCFLLMLIAYMFMFVTSTGSAWFDVAGVAVLIVFLSLGAPNQPGSILIGSLIIILTLQSFEMLCVAIYAEAVMGSALNITNAIGDIVAIAIEERDCFKETSHTDHKTAHTNQETAHTDQETAYTDQE